MKVYVVEDDESIRELIVYALNANQFDAQGFSDAEAFYAGMEESVPDLVLLDIMLPGEDGISILKRLRSALSAIHEIPVIMLTAKSTEYDKVLGLEAGADDYIVKPFGVMELISRVRAVLRRSASASGGKELAIGPIRVDPARYRTAVADKEIALTIKEFELLRAMMENPGYVFSRDQLLERVWGYAFDGETRTVDVHIRSLRKKLEDGGNQIETVRGVGYRIG